MTTDQFSVVMGVFRDHKLAEQAIEELKQTDWIVDDPQLLEQNARGLFGAFKNARTSRETEAELLSDTLAGIDLPEDQQQLYQHELAQGSSLVLAHPQSHLLEIRDILTRYGGYHIFVPFQIGGEQTVTLRREVPQIQKQLVDVGEIRIHKRVITEDRTFTIPVTREEVTIERLPRPSTSQVSPQMQMATADTSRPTSSPAFSSPEEETLREEGTLRIFVREEQVIIQKQVVVVEEITIQKQIVQDIQHLVEPVKHEEVHIERLGKAPVHETTIQKEFSTAQEESPAANEMA